MLHQVRLWAYGRKLDGLRAASLLLSVLPYYCSTVLLLQPPSASALHMPHDRWHSGVGGGSQENPSNYPSALNAFTMLLKHRHYMVAG